MQVEFRNIGYIEATLFSASFKFVVPISRFKTNIELWKRLVSDDFLGITIYSSNLMPISKNAHDVAVITKNDGNIIFNSPLYCFDEKYTAGSETCIPYVYCKDAFNRIVEYLEKI